MVTYEFIRSTEKIPHDKMNEIVSLLWQLDITQQRIIDAHPVFRKLQYSFVGKEEDKPKYVKERLNSRTYDLYLAKDNDRIIGVGTIHPGYPTPKTVYIGNLFVDTTYRGQGIASELMSQVHSNYKSKFRYSALGVLSPNTAAKGLYYKLGYKDASDGSFVSTSKFSVSTSIERIQDETRNSYINEFCKESIVDTFYQDLGATRSWKEKHVFDKWSKAHVFKITHKDTTYYALGFVKIVAHIFGVVQKKDIDIITSTLLHEYNNDALILVSDSKETTKLYRSCGYELLTSMLYRSI